MSDQAEQPTSDNSSSGSGGGSDQGTTGRPEIGNQAKEAVQQAQAIDAARKAEESANDAKDNYALEAATEQRALAEMGQEAQPGQDERPGNHKTERGSLLTYDPGTRIRTEQQDIRGPGNSMRRVASAPPTDGAAGDKKPQTRQDKGDRAGAGLEKGRPAENSRPRISATERATRQSKAEDLGDDTIGFDFGEDSLTKASKEKVKDVVERIDQNQNVIIIGKTSRPGSDQYNDDLSERRAENVKAEMVKLGHVPDKIDIVAQGERYAEEAGQPEGWDSPYDRVAVIVTSDTPAPVKQNEYQEPLDEREGYIALERQMGEHVFDRALEPVTEAVKEQHHLEENPVMDAPSEDVGEFLEQTAGLTKEALESLKDPVEAARFLGKMVGGALIDVAIGGRAGEVAESRRPHWAAASEAIAGALDPDYKPNVPENPDVRKTYDNTRRAIENLSKDDRYRMALMLTESYRNDLGATGPATKNYLEKNMNGSSFRIGAMRIFEMSKYRYR